MEYVWVKPLTQEEFHLPFGAFILKKLHKKVKIRDDMGNEMYVSENDILRPMHPTCVKDVDDMVMMGDLQEYSILRNLELRYKKNLIYTYTGNILIAVNPYQIVSAYGAEEIQKYRNKKLGELPPHLFAIGDVSYQNMILKKERQCIIINGESGAGKTYAAEILLHYYAAITGKLISIEKQILESIPILEAFGNAKTTRNDNSSRFGKYIFINFNKEGNIEQAEIKQFLLEKSRIVTQSKEENNYHIFYMLMRGLSKEEKHLLGLNEVSLYNYLMEGKIRLSNSETEIVQFRRFLKALKILNFTEDEIWKIFELLAVILHFGNVKYIKRIISGMEEIEIQDSVELNFISTIMGVSIQCLKSCLTKRTISTHLDSILKALNKQEAIRSRDAFVKAIYENLFNFVVNKINETIHRRKTDMNYYIGILDMFGFENFKCNSFEQFCINLANETLQQFFIHYTFKLEQINYTDEGITWKNIPFVDNKQVIDLLILKPMNIMSIINDETKLESSTSETLLIKLMENHGEDQHFFRPKFKNIQVFGIQHFAGVVLYDVQDFLEKNRDTYSSNFKNLIRLSKNGFLKNIFSHDFEDNLIGSQSKKRMQTSSAKFKNSLDSLLMELNQCQPFFVRCIKPNESKKPNSFDRKLCYKQLRYSGLWETSKIRQIGYSIRYTYKEFVEHYRMLKRSIPRANSLSKLELRKTSQIICEMVLKTRIDHQFGHTKIFLKNPQYLLLEKEREKFLSHYILILQKTVRKWLCQKRYLALKVGAIAIQKCWRRKKCLENYKTMRHGLLRLQALIHSRFQKNTYMHLNRFIIRFQAVCRGHVCRKKFEENLKKKKIKNEEIVMGAENIIRDDEAFVLNVFCENENIKARIKKESDICLNKNSIKQESFLHNHLLQVNIPDNFAAMSSFLDDSFNFLYQHS